MGAVETLFGREGPLHRALPAFETRPQQVRMAQAVLEAIASGHHLLAEAGTGVGKSLAYLVPAILWATRRGEFPPEERRVVISTHTRALQEQLARKDLPLLERALAPGVEFRHALLMGSENYLCVQRLHQAQLLAGAPADGPETRLLRDLERHAGQASGGLRSEIPFPVPEPLWARVRRDREICLGARGPFWENCLYRRDLLRAREAHLLVVNHALFFLDLATGGRILPPHAVVILDEAHRVEEAALDQFGISISDRAVARLLDDLVPRRPGRRRAAPALPGALRDAAASVAEAAAGFFDDVREQARRLAERGRGERGPAAGRLPGILARVRQAGLMDDRLGGPLRELEEALRQAGRDTGDPADGPTLAALAERARDLRERIELFLSQRQQDAVYWVEAGGGGRRSATALHVTPVEVAPILRQRLFGGERRVILTSATLTATGSFAHVRTRLGLTAADEVALGSPFDFERQALLYLPRALPDPVAAPADYAAAVIEECRRLVLASDGGAFILFTSYALLERAHAALQRPTEEAGLALFRHRPGEASSILEAFRMTRRGVLLGTLTFWQGVDVPGDALRSVIMTRLPFEVPDHPLAEARAEAIRSRGGDPFSEDALPEAILTFRQGFGRLIRSADDRGLVAALDPRLLTRGYGGRFLESLPPCRRTDAVEEVQRFFAAGRGASDA
jgi:ATP-dependent DNA helicase DinG